VRERKTSSTGLWLFEFAGSAITMGGGSPRRGKVERIRRGPLTAVRLQSTPTGARARLEAPERAERHTAGGASLTLPNSCETLREELERAAR
jgi:hypothetical protein